MPVVPFNDSGRQARDLRSELQAAMTEVLDSGWYVHGKQHQAFEAEFAQRHGVEHGVGVASGSDALEIGLLAAGVGPNDTVVTVANAGFYASGAILKIGATPRFVDVRSDDGLLDVEDLAKAIDDDPTPAAVVVTHLYGQMADVGGVIDLCRPRGVAVVEDCAQAAGAERDGVRAGAAGDVGAFSFYPTKNLGAYGDGGAILTNDAAVASKARRLRQYGWGAKYSVEDPGGRNSRLDELQAALLRVKLPNLDRWNERRRCVARAYAQALSASRSARLLNDPGPSDVCHLAVVVVEDREAARRTLAEAGVETACHYPIADHRQPILQGHPEADRPLPVTDELQERILSIPCFSELRDDEVRQVSEALAVLP